MMKRVMAWVLLIGFVLLIINIVFIGYQRSTSFVVYLVIAACFLFVMNKNKNNVEKR